ncbi:hypothetical protein JCM14076_27510 [Methylosoma difficile]
MGILYTFMAQDLNFAVRCGEDWVLIGSTGAINVQCFIYKSLKKEFLYLYVKTKDDFSGVPEALLSMMGKMEFVLELQLSLERKLASEDVGKVMGHLQDHGFFVQLPKMDLPLN